MERAAWRWRIQSPTSAPWGNRGVWQCAGRAQTAGSARRDVDLPKPDHRRVPDPRSWPAGPSGPSPKEGPFEARAPLPTSPLRYAGRGAALVELGARPGRARWGGGGAGAPAVHRESLSSRPGIEGRGRARRSQAPIRRPRRPRPSTGGETPGRPPPGPHQAVGRQRGGREVLRGRTSALVGRPPRPCDAKPCATILESRSSAEQPSVGGGVAVVRTARQRRRDAVCRTRR